MAYSKFIKSHNAGFRVFVTTVELRIDQPRIGSNYLAPHT